MNPNHSLRKFLFKSSSVTGVSLHSLFLNSNALILSQTKRFFVFFFWSQPGPCSEEETRTYLIAVDQCLCTIARWAKAVPRTYRHMLLIVYAEKRRVLRACPYAAKLDPKLFHDAELEEKDRYELYRMAITSATESGITAHVGLCHELTMR